MSDQCRTVHRRISAELHGVDATWKRRKREMVALVATVGLELGDSRSVGRKNGDAEGLFGRVFGNLNRQLSLVEHNAHGRVGRRDFGDGVDAENVEQTAIRVDLTVAVEVVGVGERRVVVAARATDDFHRLLGCERGLGLQPKGNGSSDGWRCHRSAGIGIPRVGTTLKIKVFHVGANVAGLGVVFEIITAVRRNNVRPWRHHIGLDSAVVGRSDRRIATALSVGALVVGTVFAEVVGDARAIARRPNANDTRRTRRRMDVVGGDGIGQQRIQVVFVHRTHTSIDLDFSFFADQFKGNRCVVAHIAVHSDFNVETGFRRHIARRIGRDGEEIVVSASWNRVDEARILQRDDAARRNVNRNCFFAVKSRPKCEGSVAFRRECEAFARISHESSRFFAPSFFVDIGEFAPFVACRGHENAPRTNQCAQHFVVKHVVAVEILLRTLAKRDDARLIRLFGIVENVLEAKRVGGEGVFVVVGAVDEGDVFSRGVGNEADVALVGHSAIFAVVATAGCRAERVGAVGLRFAVVATAEREQFSLGGVVATHVECAADGVVRNLVPKPTDAVIGARRVVEIRVRQVETNVHHAHDNALSRECRGKISTFVNRSRIQLNRHRIHVNLVAASCLDSLDLLLLRQFSQLMDRNRNDVNIAFSSQFPTAMLAENRLGIAFDADESTNLRCLFRRY